MQYVILGQHPPDLCPTSNAKTRERIQQMMTQILGVGLCALLVVAAAARGADSRLPSGSSPWESAQRHRSNHGYLPLIPEQDTVWCFCPAVICSHGKEAGCTAACYAPKSPRCRCEAQCDLYAKPVGSNLCRCD